MMYPSREGGISEANDLRAAWPSTAEEDSKLDVVSGSGGGSDDEAMPLVLTERTRTNMYWGDLVDHIPQALSTRTQP